MSMLVCWTEKELVSCWNLFFTHFENEAVGGEVGGDYDSKGENSAEHVPEAQGVCRKPHWPGKDKQKQWGGFSTFADWDDLTSDNHDDTNILTSLMMNDNLTMMMRSSVQSSTQVKKI